MASSLAVLQQQPQRSATYLRKLLLSAVSNWHQRNAESLEYAHMVVRKITVDRAGMLKRVMPAPRGVAHRIRRRLSHVNIVVDRLEKDTQEETPIMVKTGSA